MPRKDRPQQKPRYPLPEWAVQWLLWFLNEPKGGRSVPKVRQCEVATMLANRNRDPALPELQVTWDQIRTIRAHPQFIETKEKYELGGEEAARALWAHSLPMLVALHAEGAALAQAKKDYRSYPLFTSQAIKHISAGDTTRQQAIINITISEKREALITSERPVIEAEVVALESAEEPQRLGTGT